MEKQSLSDWRKYALRILTIGAMLEVWIWVGYLYFTFDTVHVKIVKIYYEKYNKQKINIKITIYL